MRRRRVALAALAVTVASARGLLAQCPDGTPPPCGARVVAARRVVPPDSAARRRQFMILPFRNITGDSAYNWLIEGATFALRDALERWRDVRVVPPELLFPALERASLRPGGIMDIGRLGPVAEQTGGWTAVLGEVYGTRRQLQIAVRAMDVVTGRQIASLRLDVESEADPRRLLESGGASLLRTTAGLDASAAEPVVDATTSLEAYRAYLEGQSLFRRAQFRRASTALLEAIRLDSTYAAAYAQLAITALFRDPTSILKPGNMVQRYAARAAELTARLPGPRQRLLAQATNALMQAQFSEARRVLEALSTIDSNDVQAIALLGLVEYVDPVLVPVGGGERPRGSLNSNARLARRVLELSPDFRSAYIPLVYANLLAAGDLPGILLGVRREAASFTATITQGMPRFFVPLLRDTFLLVPAESLGTWPADSLAAARRRALAGARAWTERWIAAGADDGEAWLAAAKVSELQGDYPRALREVALADSLGVESGLNDPRVRRLVLSGQLRRYADAYQLADQLWGSGLFDVILPVPSSQTEGLGWVFNLALMRGDAARAEAALQRFQSGLRTVTMLDPGLLAGASLSMIAGMPLQPFWQLGLPAAFRADVMDSVWARRGTAPDGSWLARTTPTLARLTSRAAVASGDSVLVARARASAWYQP